MRSFSPTVMVAALLALLLLAASTTAKEHTAVARAKRRLKGGGMSKAEKDTVSGSEDFGDMTMPEEGSGDEPEGVATTDAPTGEPEGDATDAPNVEPEDDATDANQEVPPDFNIGTEMDLEFRLEYGFFEGTEVREPTEEELDGLVESTELFYSEWLSDASSSNITDYSLDSFVITSRLATFVPDDLLFPVLVYVTANLKFTLTGENNVLGEEDLYAAMQLADYSQYIRGFIWESSPEGSLFHDTQRVYYSDPESTRPPSMFDGTTSPTLTMAPTV